MMRYFHILVCSLTVTGACAQEMNNLSKQAEGEERLLLFEVVAKSDLASLWNAFTNEDELGTWLAPTVKMNLKQGGKMKIHYPHHPELGKVGTMQHEVIAIVPMRAIVLNAHLSDVFPKPAVDQDEDLSLIILFEEMSSGFPRVTISYTGFGNGEYWNQTYERLEMITQWSCELLNQRFLSGPVKW